MPDFVRRTLSHASPGVWVIFALALLGSALIVWLPPTPRAPVQFWIFARQHAVIYRGIIDEWNRTRPADAADMTVLNRPVMEQRMMSAFLSGTPVADVFEVERDIAGRAFTGPIEVVGFVDLTDRLREEGLLEAINTPSFSPWTSRGRIFGLPHDVHPVLLMYRADLVEAAGIDVTEIETWDDYFRVMGPLQQDLDGDGRVDRYLLSASPAYNSSTEVLLLQAGGRLFDEQERLTIDTELNAAIIARMATWHVGPGRVCRFADVALTQSGQQVFLDGLVLGVLTPDWLVGVLKQQVPGLAGKVRLMPIPAWERGGRRTSVWGGTMLGFARSSPDFERNWAFGKALYLSEEGAEMLFRTNNIVTPIKANWSNPIYDEPDPYFGGQATGRAYLDQAPHVPLRPSSPFNAQAVRAVTNAVTALTGWAESNQVYTAEALLPEARRQLNAAHRLVADQMRRNQFLTEGR
jgi:arabinosaccharide transport system substrate-binding protein